MHLPRVPCLRLVPPGKGIALSAPGRASRRGPPGSRRPPLRLEQLEPRLVLGIIGGGGNPPAAPTNLTATATGTYEIDLAWTDNSNNETGFAVQRSTDGTNFAQIGTVGADVTIYRNAGLAAGTTYY